MCITGFYTFCSQSFCKFSSSTILSIENYAFYSVLCVVDKYFLLTILQSCLLSRILQGSPTNPT